MKNCCSYSGHFPGFYTGYKGPVSPDVQLTCGVREMVIVLDMGDGRLKEGRCKILGAETRRAASVGGT